MGKINKQNQSGATAIMFAMFFIIVISLITIGFATLARRDQRSTLDKTISYQAQYATESIVNLLQQKAKAGGLTTKDACLNEIDRVNTGIPNKIGAVDVTCVGWDVAPKELAFDLDPYQTKSFINEGSLGFTEVTWWAEDGTTKTAQDCPDKLCSDTIPFIKISTAKKSDIYSENGSMRVAYLVPTNLVPPTAVNTTSENGKDFFVGCNSGVCTARITHSGVGGPRAYFFQPIGAKRAKVVFKEYNSSSFAPANLITIPGVMVKVEVNVKQTDQNVNKRLITYVSLQPDTFQPFAGVVGDSLCKDYKTDGSQGGVCNGGVPAVD